MLAKTSYKKYLKKIDYASFTIAKNTNNTIEILNQVQIT
jgi:hypothetical protein